jgi:hypothetical protein
MAFCNSCGEKLDTGARFCAKCGASQPGGATMPVTPSSPAPSALTPAAGAQPQSSNALKIILIIVAVFVGLGILGAGTAAFIGWRIAHHTRVTDKDGNVRVESPFGTIESNNNQEETEHNLGVEIYPGATMKKGNSANITVAGMHTSSAEFETGDSADKVADFYKSKFPNANVTTTDGDHTTIVSTDKKNLITISIEPAEGKTVIHIANVSGKGMSGSSPN